MYPDLPEAIVATELCASPAVLRYLVAITRSSHHIPEVRKRLIQKAVQLEMLGALPLQMRQEALDMIVAELRELEEKLR